MAGRLDPDPRGGRRRGREPLKPPVYETCPRLSWPEGGEPAREPFDQDLGPPGARPEMAVLGLNRTMSKTSQAPPERGRVRVGRFRDLTVAKVEDTRFLSLAYQDAMRTRRGRSQTAPQGLREGGQRRAGWCRRGRYTVSAYGRNPWPWRIPTP